MTIETSTIGAEMTKLNCSSYAELRDAGHDDLADILQGGMSFGFPIHKDTDRSESWIAGSPNETDD